MVSEIHPHDIELFEFVEDELPESRREEIAAHLATCSACAQQVELASAGREALHGASVLELPDRRRADILKNLPKQERAPGEQRAFSPKLVFAGLLTLLFIAAVIGIVVSSNGNSGLESSAGGTGGGADAAATGGGQAESAKARTSLFSGGPAEEIAEELQRKGFEAVVQKDRVVVHGATKAQVREALADRGVGDVEVVVKNP